MIPQPQDIAIDGRNRRHLTYMLSRRQALCCLGCRLLHHARCPFNPSTSFYLFCRIVPLLAPWWARLSISDWSTQLPENIFHGSIHYIPFNLLGRDSLLMIWFSRSCPSLDRCSYIYHKIATLNLCLYNNWPLPWDATYSFNLNMTSAELVNSLVLGKSELHVVGICSVHDFQCPRISSKDCYEWNRQFHLNSMSYDSIDDLIYILQSHGCPRGRLSRPDGTNSSNCKAELVRTARIDIDQVNGDFTVYWKR